MEEIQLHAKKKKRITAQVFSTVVKCLDVFAEKLKLVTALMWTFHLRTFRADVSSRRVKEGIHKLRQPITKNGCRVFVLNEK